MGRAPDFSNRQSVNSYPLNEGALQEVPWEGEYRANAFGESYMRAVPSNSYSSSGSDPSAHGKQLSECAGGQSRSSGLLLASIGMTPPCIDDLYDSFKHAVCPATVQPADVDCQSMISSADVPSGLSSFFMIM